LGESPKGTFVTLICDVTKQLFFKDKQLFEKHFGYARMVLNLI
tara:strand:- start:10 stop:138 length:129 start_codon:yes stop_codon:yes gene_type:complete